jgi:hypothetical protein
MLESAGESEAVQVPPVVAVPAFGAHVWGDPRACVPFINWTVPVGPAPLLVEPVTVALRVTVPPVATVVALEVMAAVVAVVPEELAVMVLEPVFEE